MPDESPSRPPGATAYAGRLLAVVATVVVIAVVWLLSDLLLLLFAAIVVAVALRSLADLLVRRLRVPEGWSVLVAVSLIAVVLAVVGWFAGDALVAQFGNLRDRLEALPGLMQTWLRSHPIGLQLLDLWNDAVSEGLPVSQVMGVARLTLSAVGNLALIIIVAAYLAASPRLYRNGLLRLVPLPWRERTGSALDRSGAGLRGWLKGQAVSMLFVGVSTGLALALLGVPLALTVGLLSGLLAFIPFFGAIAGGALAVMVAFIDSPQTAAWVALICVVIQQIEGNALMPLIQRRIVSLPPVLGILAAVVFGVLFGIVGVFFATPLMIVAMILVQSLYVEDFLERGQHGRQVQRGA
ncbi:MAG: AI-2E family transporter [Comamonadaceae bacterium]|nr:AI-2E family transporter [Comamonadaceae bacterium]